METNEKILSLIREKGPILPVHASKEINETILMTSARLSELLTSKKIRISNLKVGGSPLYYFPGQEIKLQNFTDNLNEMERKAYELLSQNKILKDINQEPAIRVALRQIKDFAVPLQVNYENNTEIFWKWYLVDNTEAESSIKTILSAKKETIPDKKIEKSIEIPKEEIKNDPINKTIEKPITEIKKELTKKTIDKDSFLKEIHNYFNINKIKIEELQNKKKNTEIDFIIQIQTSIGYLKYFCKAKNKKKINEADLSSALINSQSNNLPLLFLTNGDLTKKTIEMLNNEFKNIIIKKI